MSPRPACVCVPALPLQLLVRQHPAWRAHPVAVVDQDRPQGVVQWVNERALQRRILPGMRFAAALALDAALRAGPVDPLAVVAAGDEIVAALRPFSPAIEVATEPGVLWLDAGGLDGLFPSLSAWAEGVVAALRRLDLLASVVVGFDRFATYALARTRRGALVLADAEAERAAAARVPLHRLRLDPGLRDALTRLGVHDVAAFLALRRADLLARFDAAAAPLHPDATLRPLVEPAHAHCDLEPGTHGLDRSALLFLAKARLEDLRATLAARGRAVAALLLDLHLEKGQRAACRVQPAAPTLDAVQLLELLALRLETLVIPGEIEGFDLRAEEAPASAEQLQLFGLNPHRDLAAGNRALARLRAEFGDDAVQCAEPADGHLPEAQVRWQRCVGLRHAEPRPALHPRLVRRVLTTPLRLPHQQAGADGWFAGALNFGPVQNLFGPHVLAGGWWRRAVHRDYYFAETRRGDLLWIFHDRQRQRWCSHGAVE